MILFGRDELFVVDMRRPLLSVVTRTW